MLVSFLREHVDVFTWKPTDMLGVPRELIEHSLNVSVTTKTIKQNFVDSHRTKRRLLG